MARLAAYYQEDFHYPSVGNGHKQRKSTYLVYEEPRNNLFQKYMFNGNRIRGLATSEPSLSPSIIQSSNVDTMTLKQRPVVYGNQFIQRPHSSFQQFENNCRPSSRFDRSEHDSFDNESILSFCDVPDNRYNHRYRSSRNSERKRFSYAEPSCREIYIQPGSQGNPPERLLQESDFRNYNDRLHSDSSYVSSPEHNLNPTGLYRSESRQGKWPQWPLNRTLLPPPSPLDSGLSSQSIASSPSLLDTEPVMFHNESYPVSQMSRHPSCSCAHVSPQSTPMDWYDSGRKSPGCRSMSQNSILSPGVRSRLQNGTNGVAYAADDFVNNQHSGQIRYGKLGLLGEPTDSEQIIPKKAPDNFQRQYRGSVRHHDDNSYIYVDENGVPLRKAHKRKSHKSAHNYIRPCVIIIETPEKAAGSEIAMSPEHETSDKSQGPESPMSMTISNSTSESVTSSNNELDIGEQRKSNKTTELEIRELEDMYEKCNLGDKDLLDRAERRDLPTAHQTRTEPRLTRSNSDTLYETMGPVFRNPYETHQRAPPFRRAGLPDRIADDMALRKLRKPSTRRPSNLVDNSISYMLCSSHFTPTVPADRDFLMLDNPDVELDDLSYRKHYFGKKSKILDPQPPFGIPLRPPPPQRVYNNYLHVVPSNVPQPLCHPRGNPDVVRDDMAFRTLRKDEPERVYYDIAQVYKKR